MTNNNPKNDLIKWTPKPNQSRDNIIVWLYSRKDLLAIINKMTKDQYLADELRSEVFLHLSEQTAADIIDWYNRKIIDWKFINFIDTQFNSSTSPFYKIKRGAFPKELIQKAFEILYPETNQDIKDVYHESLLAAINKLKSPEEFKYKDYHKQIMTEYLKQGYSIKKVSEELNIRPEYISKAIKDAKEMLKPTITKDVQDYLNNKIDEPNVHRIQTKVTRS